MGLGIAGTILCTRKMGQICVTETTYPAQFHLLQHAHDYAAFGIVVEGQWHEMYDTSHIACGSGELYYRPPEIPHSNCTEEIKAHCLYLEVTNAWLCRMEPYAAILSRPFSTGGADVEALAHRVWLEWRRPDEVTPLAIEGLLCELVVTLSRDFRRLQEGGPPLWLRRVRELLCDCFSDPPSLAELSEQVGVHRAHVARQFRRYYGMTIGECIRKQRIQFACRQLLNPKLSIADIAIDAGFSHQAHFTSTFRHTMGMTPNQYRMLRTG